MIVLTAVFKAQSSKEADLEKVLSAMIPKVQEEEGTLVYILNRSATDKGRFLFYEMYRDQAALDFHSSTPYFQDLLANIEGLVAEPPQIEAYEDIAAIRR